ncbi:hypothetical protein [Bacillus phage CP-51]|uniref:Uncharacterized protein n=1 Tax=Bacillus phage CP-51 TaxID=1391188 RepID=A0A068EPG0_9CAUD|nr:hypothetical protein OZ73_gp179 [Bacillus phage CP-51]AID50614.1 hypothetical protein [Bacillus phage CP-51]
MYTLETCKECRHEKVCKFIDVFKSMKDSGVPVDYEDPSLCTAFEPDIGSDTGIDSFISGLLKSSPNVQFMSMDQYTKEANDKIIRNHLSKTDPDAAIKQMNEQILSAIRDYQVKEGVDPDMIKFNPETLTMVGLEPTGIYSVPGFGDIDVEYEDDMELGMFWLGHVADEDDDEEEGTN